jgi:hypothetical protein
MHQALVGEPHYTQCVTACLSELSCLIPRQLRCTSNNALFVQPHLSCHGSSSVRAFSMTSERVCKLPYNRTACVTPHAQELLAVTQISGATRSILFSF